MSNLPSNPLKRSGTYNYNQEVNYKIPEVSIITPFYNVQDIFLETIFCVLNQSFQNFEWIVVDDCSTDAGSLSLLKTLELKDKRIRIIRTDLNGGPGAARNRGIKEAKAKYLFFVDADDLLEFSIIEKYWLFLNFNTEYFFCNAWHYGFGEQQYIWKKGFEKGIEFLKANPIQPTFMARKLIFNFVEFDETIRDGFEDWDFWLRCASAGFWGYTIKEYLYWYRRVSNVSLKWQNWDMGEKMKSFQQSLQEKYTEKFLFQFPTPNFSTYERGKFVINPLNNTSSPNRIAKSQNLRIFFIIPWMSLGGADKFNLDLVKGFVEKGIEMTIITTQYSENGWLTNFLEYTPDIFVLHNYGCESNAFAFIQYLINSRIPDCILFSNSEIGYYLSPLIKYSFPNIPLIDYNHMEEAYWNLGGHPKQSVIYDSVFDCHAVSSFHLKNWMIDQGGDSDKIEVVYTGIDYSKVSSSEEIRNEVRKKWQIDNSLCIIMFSGRITNQKQPMVLVSVIKELANDLTDGFVLAIVGDGPDKQMLEKWVLDNNLSDKIWFLGALTNDETINIMRASDIFFLPSLWEGISLAAYEAMSVGLPIVSAQVGGQKELVTPREGFLIPRNIPEREINDYAKILKALIIDKDKRIKMGEAARLRIEKKFGIQNMFDKMEQVIKTTIKEEKIRPKTDILQAFQQVYGLLFFEKRLAENLWYTNQSLQSVSKDHKSSPRNSSISVNKAEHDVSWYHANYEILPKWYKRVGHLLKIMNGSRDWRTLYNEKYKNNPFKMSEYEWYAKEYEVLPGWYKKFGKMLKKEKNKNL